MSKKSGRSTVKVEKYEEVRNLLATGKERGFLAYDEISEALPDELSQSPEAIEDVVSLFETNGIELVDSDTKEHLSRPESPRRSKGKGTEVRVGGRPTIFA